MKIKNEVIGRNHLLKVSDLLKKSVNLLNEGRDILPYSKWKDALEQINDEISEELENSVE